MSKPTKSKADDRKPIPFDEVARRLLNTPPTPLKPHKRPKPKR